MTSPPEREMHFYFISAALSLCLMSSPWLMLGGPSLWWSQCPWIKTISETEISDVGCYTDRENEFVTYQGFYPELRLLKANSCDRPGVMAADIHLGVSSH